MSGWFRAELASALRALLESAPKHDALPSERANYCLRKAEFLDYVAVAEAGASAQALLAAARARHQAQDIALGF
jgi:hypothetical protein